MSEKKKKDPGQDTNADTGKVNASESDPDFFRDSLIGKQLGKCKIEKLIGEGKTSVVYRANYAPLRRTVAVKVLQEHLKKFPALLKVFQQEGRAVAALDHENILKIYDVGEDDGHHYLVLELLRGKTLLEMIEATPKGEFSLQEALELTRQAASGLAAAHRKNLVHRDIKPQNLVIEPDGTLKIVDFGLAAEAEGAFSGGRLGTPHYMAPEQCRGEMAGTASDVYALGITLFHMLVGHPPYTGSVTTDEIIAGHLSGERLEPEKIRPDIPKAVAELVRRMTRSDMTRRPTAQEIRDGIAKSKPERPASGTVRRSRAVRSARRRARTSSSNTGIIIVVVVVLIVLVLLMTMGGKDDEPSRESANTPPVVDTPTTKPGETKPVQKPEEKPKPDRAESDKIQKLLEEARGQETAKDWPAALGTYQKVLLEAKPGTQPYLEAKDAAEGLKDLINAQKGDKPLRRKYITAMDSQAAGAEFEEKVPAWLKQLAVLECGPVLAEMGALLERMRDNSAEAGVAKLAIRRARYIEGIVKMCEARAHGLSGGKEFWSTYDYNAAGDLIVTGANEQGLLLKGDDAAEATLTPWAKIDGGILVGFLDALRSGGSAEESLWLGYFCRLIGDDRDSQYFDFALLGDPSGAMKAEVAALKGN